MRKLVAAGAQATLSPVRKPTIAKENAEAGPSRGRRRMDPVGEEEEDEEEESAKPQPRRSDLRDEALYQKARVVTGNAGLFVRDRENDVELVDEQPKPESHLGPASRKSVVPPAPPRRSVAASPPRKPMAPARTMSAPAPARESRPAKIRTTLYESVATTLTDALRMAQTPGGFYAPGMFFSCRGVPRLD